MERYSAIFYGSWLEAAETLTKDEATLGKAALALLRYCLRGEEYRGGNKIVKAIFIQAKPLVDANNARMLNGRRGGRPRKGGEPENGKPEVSENAAEEKTIGFENEKPKVLKKHANKKTKGSEKTPPKKKPYEYEYEYEYEDEEKEKNKEKIFLEKKKQKTVADNPPTEGEVAEFLRGNGAAQEEAAAWAAGFVGWHGSRGWTLGSAPMTDWRPAALGWAEEARRRQETNVKPQNGQRYGDNTEKVDYVGEGHF